MPSKTVSDTGGLLVAKASAPLVPQGLPELCTFGAAVFRGCNALMRGNFDIRDYIFEPERKEKTGSILFRLIDVLRKGLSRK